MTTYYIDYLNGNDSNNGTSKSSPWKRCPGMMGFSKIYSHSAGDTFIFKGGVTWTSNCLPLTIGYSGTSTNIDTYTIDKTWYNGNLWAQPTFDMQQTSSNAITIDTHNYITLDNLKIVNPIDQVAYQDMIFVGGSNSINIKNCTIDGNGGAGSSTPIELKDMNGITIDNNYIRGKSVGDGNADGILIRPWNNMKNIIIKNNEIIMAGNGGDGIHLQMESTTYDTPIFMDNCGPILIENNNFHDLGTQKMGVILISGSKDVTIRYNKFHGIIGTGCGVYVSGCGDAYDIDGSSGGPYYYWVENIQIYYNIFYLTSPLYENWAGMTKLLDTDCNITSKNNKIYNNIYWANVSYPEWQRGIFFQGDSGIAWTVKNNIFAGLTYGIDGGSNAIIDKNLFYNNQNNGTTGTNPLLSDPKFVSPSTGDFHLQSNSPAIDKGIDWGQTRDFDGNPKQGTSWDIGAYEYTSGTVCPTPIVGFTINIL